MIFYFVFSFFVSPFFLCLSLVAGGNEAAFMSAKLYGDAKSVAIRTEKGAFLSRDGDYIAYGTMKI